MSGEPNTPHVFTPEEEARNAGLIEAELKIAKDLVRDIRFNFPDVLWAKHTTEVDKRLTYATTAVHRIIDATLAQPVMKARFRDAGYDGQVSAATAIAEAIGMVLKKHVPPEGLHPALNHVINRLITTAGAMAIITGETVDVPDKLN